MVGFALHYYDAVECSKTWLDYKPVVGTSLFARPATSSNFISLFNGNIGAISINNAGFPRNNTNINGAPLFYNYRYDQLNRLVSMQAYNGFDATNNLWSAGTSSIGDYREAVSYDPNGNIMTYNRKGAPTVGSQADMDDLTYHYDANTNRLNHITDAITNSTYTEDLETQGVGNYQYDAIGNLTKDAAAGITSAGDITWNVYGKITSIKKNGSDITYTYDPSGNRITKTVAGKTTVYVRDAQGNVLSVYEYDGTTTKQSEVHLYGSSRLGMITQLTKEPKSDLLPGSLGKYTISTFTRNEKIYELTNHLGNVLATIGDKKIAVSSTSNSSLIDHFDADIVSAQDYYPFGMLQPGRSCNAGGYRYGFNGKENDNEIKGEGNQEDYGMRIYDPRVCRFLSVDPITRKYPELTPYQYSSNRPIDGIDQDGLEYATFTIFVQNGKVSSISVAKDYELKNPHTLGPGVLLKYAYIDKDGKVYKSEANSIVKNLYGIYQGDKNPQLPKIGGNPKKLYDDYSLAPIDEVDAAALKHDLAYDNLDPKQAGLPGVMDNSTTAANSEAIETANDIIKRHMDGGNDKITGKKISNAEANAAGIMSAGFSKAEEVKRVSGIANKVGSAIGNFFKSVGDKFQEIKDKTINGINSLNNVHP